MIDDAFADGRISLDHARLITTAVRKAPAEIRDVVEKELVTAAETVDPAMLGRFARELIARLTNEDVEAAAQRRYATRWLRISGDLRRDARDRRDARPGQRRHPESRPHPATRKTGPKDERTGGSGWRTGWSLLAEHAMAAGGLPEHGGELPR